MESIKSSKFVSHRARMPRKFNSRKIDIQTKASSISTATFFIEVFDSKLSTLRPLANMVISRVNYTSKTER